MDVTQPTDDEQTKHWNTTAGCAWVDAQHLLDQMMKGLEDLLVDGVAAGPGRRVLDVGCGTGGTTLAVARRLGAEGQCVGADVSEPMIAAARARAEWEGIPASFILGDVQTHPFERASVETISRDSASCSSTTGPGLRELAARRNRRRRASRHRLAQRRGESVHDNRRA